jgi:signal transduction histidine kinase
MSAWFKKGQLLTGIVIAGFLTLCWIQYTLLLDAVKGKEKDFNDKLFAVSFLYGSSLRTDSAAMQHMDNDSAALHFVQHRMRAGIDSVFRVNSIPLDYTIGLGATTQPALSITRPRATFDEQFDRLIWSSDPRYNEGLKSTRLRLGSLGKPPERTYFVKVFLPNKLSFLFRSMIPLIILNIFILLCLLTCFILLLQMTRRLSRLARTRNDMINNLTHELKTPLFTISVASKMLMEQPAVQADEKNTSFAKRILEETTRMKTMVDKVLHSAMNEASKAIEEKQPVAVHALIHRAVDRYAETIPGLKKAIHLQLDAQNDIIEGDLNSLETVIDNLLDNAWKYRSNDPQISISSQNDGQAIQINIRDNGIGMNAETRRQAFDRFYRGHTGDVHNSKGYGIGLSQVKSIMEAHGGSIVLKSRIDEGSEFVLRLPFS